jgi:dTDP-glucose 4,6-dehydratase
MPPSYIAKYEEKRFTISVREVYGSCLGYDGLFTELLLDPNSYSLQKPVRITLFVLMERKPMTPYVLTNCSQYGPFHFPEKLIPLFINNIIQNKPLPVYGDGKYTRDWLFVEDHAVAIDLVFIRGKPTPIILVDLMNGKYRFGVL